MQNFQDVFEKSKRSFISEFSIWMTVPLTIKTYKFDSSFFFLIILLCLKKLRQISMFLILILVMESQLAIRKIFLAKVTPKISQEMF